MPKDNGIQINEAALRRAAQPGLDRMQQQLNDELHAVLREVRDEMSGQPAAAVLAELKLRLARRIPGVQLNEDNLRQLAQEIEAGTLTD